MESLTRSTLAKIESGIREFITVDELVVIADALGLAAVDLVHPDSSARAHTGGAALPNAGQRRDRRDRVGTAVCPRCFARFNVRDTLFRCGGGRSRPGRESCELEVDPLRPYGGGVGPLFKANFRNSNSECPNCGIGTTVQVCPECHSELPAGYVQAPRNIIATVGTVNVGKSCYIASLLHELRTSVGEKLQVSAASIDDRTEYHYQHMAQSLFINGEMFPATEPRDDYDPLVFELAWHRRFSRGSRHRSSIVLYDPAGESTTSRARLSAETRFVSNSDGIIFIVDPLEVGGLSKAEAQWKLTQYSPGQDLSAMAQVIRSQNSIATDELIDIPLAVTLSKADLLEGRGLIPREDEFFNRELHLEQLKDSPPAAFNEVISSMFRPWDGGELQRSLEANFSRYSFFAVSALGAPVNRQDGPAVQLPVRPLRVTDPLMWILNELHVF